jgi:DNA-binding GntR family transcriptional regulator
VGIHDALIEALLGTDPEAAMRLMWQHIDQFFRVLRNQPDVDEVSEAKAVQMAEQGSP